MAALEESVRSDLKKYVYMARRLGFAAVFRMEVATDVVEGVAGICRVVTEEYPRSCVYTGQITFRQEKFYHRMLHNETALAIQRRLQWDGLLTVIMPIRVRA